MRLFPFVLTPYVFLIMSAHASAASKITTPHAFRHFIKRTNDLVWSPPAVLDTFVEIKQEDPSEKSGDKQLLVNKVARNAFARAKFKPIRVSLFSNATTAGSAANTALGVAANITFATSNYPEISSYAGVYDECRILGVKLHYNFYTAVLATAAFQDGAGVAALAFDPTISAPATLSSALSEAHSSGLHWVAATLNNPPLAVMNKGSLPMLYAKMPPPLAPITSSDIPGSAWFCIDGSTPPNLFTVLAYAPPIGTTGVVGFYYVTEIEAEFRLRV